MSELYLCEPNKLKSIKSVCLENASQLSNCTTSALGPKFDFLPNCHQNGRPLALLQLSLSAPDSGACWIKEAQHTLGLVHKASHFPGAGLSYGGHIKDTTKPSGKRLLGLCMHPSPQLSQSDCLNKGTTGGVHVMLSTGPQATSRGGKLLRKSRVNTTFAERLVVPWADTYCCIHSLLGTWVLFLWSHIQ